MNSHQRRVKRRQVVKLLCISGNAEERARWTKFCKEMPIYKLRNPRHPTMQITESELAARKEKEA